MVNFTSFLSLINILEQKEIPKKERIIDEDNKYERMELMEFDSADYYGTDYSEGKKNTIRSYRFEY